MKNKNELYKPFIHLANQSLHNHLVSADYMLGGTLPAK